MDQISGLPAHPLVVHAPVVLVPLATIGVIVTLVRTAWYERYRWAVLATGIAGAVGAMLAASSGEELEHGIERTGGREPVGLHAHVEAGETARNLAIVFAVVLVAYTVVPWFLARRATSSAPETPGPETAGSWSGAPTWMRPVLRVLVALAALGATVTTIDAGHSGAEVVWASEDGDAAGG